MSHQRRLLIAAIAMFALIHLASGLGLHVQAQEGPRLSIDQVVVSDDSESITVVVSVFEDAGTPVSDLSSFGVALDGEFVEVEGVSAVVNEDIGIAVLLLMDISASMEGEPLAQGRAAAAAFVAGLLRNDVVALVTFASAAPIDADFAIDREVLLQQIGAIEADQDGGTALYDAVVNALLAVSDAPTTRRAVILLTDGRDSGSLSAAARNDSLEAAALAGVPVYAIALGDEADADYLEALAQEAGGEVYEAATPGEVPAIFDAIGATLRSQYVLDLALPSHEEEQRDLLIAVDLEGTTLTSETRFVAAGAVAESDVADGSDGLVWIVVGVVVAASVALATLLVWRWRQRTPALVGGPRHSGAVSIPRPEVAPAASIAEGRLTVTEGPNSGTTVRVTREPLDIGSAAECQLQLDSAGGSPASLHVRVWLQNDRLMVHHLARGSQTIVGERPVEWATLEPGDTLQIGQHIIAFSLAN